MKHGLCITWTYSLRVAWGFCRMLMTKFLSGALQVSNIPKQLAETRPSELDTL
jgi:hypothetical protein